MIKLYSYLLAAHAVIAILGLGTIASVVIVTANARRTERSLTEASIWLGPFLRCATFALAAMVVTGVLLDIAASDAFSRMWWFRGSVLLTFATGALLGRARRAIRKSSRDDDGKGSTLRRVERIAYGMCALVAAIAVLMEVKPF